MIDLTVPGMTCGGCARGVTAAIKGLDPAAEIEIDVPARRVRVKGTATVDAVKKAMAEAGFVSA